MEDVKNSSWGSSNSSSSLTQSGSPVASPKPGRVAPPPLEVKIRTLKSDLDLLAQEGGFVATEAGQRLFVSSQTLNKNNTLKNFKWLLIVILAAGLIGFGFLGYYVLYPLVFGEDELPTQNKKLNNIKDEFSAFNKKNDSPPSGQNQNLSFQQASTNFIHQSFFRKNVDEVLTLNIKRGPALSAEDLQTYGQRLSNLISSVNSTSTFFEIAIKVDNQPMTAAQFSELLGSIIDINFLNENFNPDFTAFVYKDKNGFWPGYVFKLLPNKNWLFLKDQPAIINIERSDKLNLLFLSPPGSESSRGFEDETILNQPFRVLNYKNQGAKFIYGWVVGGYFVLSTSRGGLEEALARIY